LSCDCCSYPACLFSYIYLCSYIQMLGGISLCVHSIALELCMHSHMFLRAIYNLYWVSSMVLGTRTPRTQIWVQRCIKSVPYDDHSKFSVYLSKWFAWKLIDFLFMKIDYVILTKDGFWLHILVAFSLIYFKPQKDTAPMINAKCQFIPASDPASGLPCNRDRPSS